MHSFAQCCSKRYDAAACIKPWGCFFDAALLTGNVQLVQYLIEVQNADINAIDQVTYLLARMSHIKSPSESICVVWLVVRTDSGPSQLRHIWVTPALVSL